MSRSAHTIGRECAEERFSGRARPVIASVALAAVLGAICVAVPAWGGALYKWTDASGHVVYSDQPPPGDVKVDTISAPPPPANPNAAKELANKEMEIKKQQALATENAKKAGQQRADAGKLALACKEARGQLAALSADQMLTYRINEKGEMVYLDQTERRQRRENLEVYLKANCSQG